MRRSEDAQVPNGNALHETGGELQLAEVNAAVKRHLRDDTTLREPGDGCPADAGDSVHGAAKRSIDNPHE